MRISSRSRDACSVTAAPLATLAAGALALDLAVPGIVSLWMPLPLLVIPAFGVSILLAFASRPPQGYRVGWTRVVLLLVGVAFLAAAAVRAAGGPLVGGRFLLAAIGAMLVVVFSLLKNGTRYD